MLAPMMAHLAPYCALEPLFGDWLNGMRILPQLRLRSTGLSVRCVIYCFGFSTQVF
ncbi:hypothetical protein FP2506_16729 [Fulvimarina pelagi HTCC2506]|uniref:Uncharacterized protein n=1 Tax=Fulvimarina pelagi HTCC2506 TaxID=314231 RepID=Q0G2T4_9HYPH|nr:hypothetical protein FP2506_16729 [Fulvimarina pelagi HTCC2506]